MEEKVLGVEQEYHRAFLEDSPTHSPMHSPPQWEDEEAELPFLEFNLGPPLDLGPNVECFFQEPANKSGEDVGSDFPPEHPAEEYQRWVEWKGQAVNTLSWWQELGKIPEVGDFQELTQRIWASLKFPQQMSKMHNIKNYYLAPPAPKCLHQKDFLSPFDPMFPCWDIREE